MYYCTTYVEQKHVQYYKELYHYWYNDKTTHQSVTVAISVIAWCL